MVEQGAWAVVEMTNWEPVSGNGKDADYSGKEPRKHALILTGAFTPSMHTKGKSKAQEALSTLGVHHSNQTLWRGGHGADGASNAEARVVPVEEGSLS